TTHAARARPAAGVLARGKRTRPVPRRDRTSARDRARRGRPHPRAPPPPVGSRTGAVDRPVPSGGLDRGRLRRLVGATADRADRLRDTHALARRTGRPPRIPAPPNDPRP